VLSNIQQLFRCTLRLSPGPHQPFILSTCLLLSADLCVNSDEASVEVQPGPLNQSTISPYQWTAPTSPQQSESGQAPSACHGAFHHNSHPFQPCGKCWAQAHGPDLAQPAQQPRLITFHQAPPLPTTKPPRCRTWESPGTVYSVLPAVKATPCGCINGYCLWCVETTQDRTQSAVADTLWRGEAALGLPARLPTT